VPSAPLGAELALLALASGAILGGVAVANAYAHPGSGRPLGVPVPVLILAAVALATGALARATRLGRHVYALGGNPEAAVRAGIDARRVTVAVFALMGLLAGLAGAITTARLDAGTNSMGTLAELGVIAAAVLGGTSLAGGAGGVGAAILGAVLMQSLENGMVLLGVSSAMRQVWIGAVLVLAVWIDGALRSRA
jgi:D-xylose transport system permease protein